MYPPCTTGAPWPWVDSDMDSDRRRWDSPSSCFRFAPFCQHSHPTPGLSLKSKFDSVDSVEYGRSGSHLLEILCLFYLAIFPGTPPAPPPLGVAHWDPRRSKGTPLSFMVMVLLRLSHAHALLGRQIIFMVLFLPFPASASTPHPFNMPASP